MYYPPEFEMLRNAIEGLSQKYTNIIGRYVIGKYKVVGDAGSSNAAPQNTLEILIERMEAKEGVLKCQTAWWSDAQKDLEKLTMEMKAILQTNDSRQIEFGAKILLGALTHRYFRMEKKYTQSRYSYFSSGERCRFWCAIKYTLGLTDDLSINNQILDAVTVVNCLELFRGFMLSGKKEKVYKSYPYIGVDLNFESHLDEMIQSHRARRGKQTGLKYFKSNEGAQTGFNQYRVIEFFESLAKSLALEVEHNNSVLLKWCNRLEKDHPDFKQLTLSEVKEHLDEHVDPGSVKKILDELLASPLIKEPFDSMVDLDDFVERMESGLSLRGTLVAAGAYVLLTQSGGEDAVLIQEVLGNLLNKTFNKSEDWKPGEMREYLEYFTSFYRQLPAGTLNLSAFKVQDGSLEGIITRVEFALELPIVSAASI